MANLVLNIGSVQRAIFTFGYSETRNWIQELQLCFIFIADVLERFTSN